MSTGGRTVSVAINGSDDITPDVADMIASRIRVANFQGVVVPATQSITITSRSMSPDGVPTPAFAVIVEELDDSLPGGQWYVVSLPASPSQYAVDRAWAYTFADGRLGVVLSPAHPPVVASVMSCLKGAGVAAVYARYSESVVKTAAPSLDYGLTPVACSVGADDPAETQFICSGTDGQSSFSLHVPDGVTAQASGTPMATGTVDSTGMQRDVTLDGCFIYKPSSVN